MALGSTLTGTWQVARIVAAALPVVRARDADGAERARRHLAGVPGQLRGLPTKRGQWLATGAVGEAFAGSAEGWAPLAWPRMQAALAEAWGLVPELPGTGPAPTYRLDLAGHRRMRRDAIERESDYRCEAAVQRRARSLAGRGVVVPRIQDEVCREVIPVQDWDDGETWVEAAAWDQDARDAAGLAQVGRFLRHTLRERVVHADPKSGNLRLRRAVRGIAIVQYDHGCMRELSPERGIALRRLVHDQRRRSGSPIAKFTAVGCDAAKLRHLAGDFPGILAIELAPMLIPGIHAARDGHPVHELNQLLGAGRWWFRAAGRPELFLLPRAFAGLVRHLHILACRVERHLTWCRAVDETLPRLSSTSHQPPAESSQTRLHVRVTAGSDLVAEIDLPVASAIDFPELLVTQVAEAVLRLDLDLDALIESCRLNRWRPCPLVDTPYRRSDGAMRHRRVHLQ